jgi:hypothetical protein
MDPYGIYASYSTFSMKQRYQTHNAILRVIARQARQIGCEVQVEPNSTDLLNGRLDEDTMTHLFSKTPSSAVQRVADQIDEMSQNINFRQDNQAILNCFNEAVELCKQTAPSANNREKAIADVLVITPDDNVAHVIDVAVPHTLGTCLDAQFFHCQTIFEEERDAFNTHQAPLPNTQPSHKVGDTINRKLNTYALLVALMNVQQASGQSPHKAISVPAIISHHGEMSPHLFSSIESCVSQYRSAFRAQNLLFSDPDGRNVFQATAHYREQFKDDIFNLQR